MKCSITSVSSSAISLLPLYLALLCTGCDDGPLKVGVANWMPQSTGGPVESRPLPPAGRVHEDFRQWLEADASAKVRLYETTLHGESNQISFTVRTKKGETPLGATYFTTVTFIYRDITNGQYQLERTWRGKQQPDFLRLNAQPKKVLLQLFGTPEESAEPRLKIVAIENVESREVLVAELGRKSQ